MHTFIQRIWLAFPSHCLRGGLQLIIFLRQLIWRDFSWIKSSFSFILWKMTKNWETNWTLDLWAKGRTCNYYITWTSEKIRGVKNHFDHFWNLFLISNTWWQIHFSHKYTRNQHNIRIDVFFILLFGLNSNMIWINILKLLNFDMV